MDNNKLHVHNWKNAKMIKVGKYTYLDDIMLQSKKNLSQVFLGPRDWAKDSKSI